MEGRERERDTVGSGIGENVINEWERRGRGLQ